MNYFKKKVFFIFKFFTLKTTFKYFIYIYIYLLLNIEYFPIKKYFKSRVFIKEVTFYLNFLPLLAKILEKPMNNVRKRSIFLVQCIWANDFRANDFRANDFRASDPWNRVDPCFMDAWNIESQVYIYMQNFSSLYMIQQN